MSGGRTLILPTARKYGHKAGMKPKDTDENLESVSCSACEGMGKKEKRQMNPDVHSSLGTITMA